VTQLSNLEAIGVSIIAWRGTDTSALFVERVHAQDFDLFVWTIDQPADILRVVDFGVDGVISNRPRLVGALVPEPSTGLLVGLGLVGLLVATPSRSAHASSGG
jgi:glycerophosphoryl diester phosphodiesterase